MTIINTENGVFVFGKNLYGELGLGHFNSVSEPTKIDIPMVINYYHSAYYSLFNTVEGLYVCGYNQNGNLGLGHYKNINISTKVELPEIIEFSGPFIKTFDGVYASGRSYFRDLGLGENKNINKFTKLKIPDVIKIYNKYKSSVFITYEGIYMCGMNYNNMFQLGNFNKISTPTKIYNIPVNVVKFDWNTFTVVIMTDDSIFVSNKYDLYQFTKLDIKNPKYIKTSMFHYIIISDKDNFNDIIYVCDKDDRQQHILPKIISLKIHEFDYLFIVIKTIDGMYEYNCDKKEFVKIDIPEVIFYYVNRYRIFVTVDGVYVDGDNSCGQLGLGHCNYVNELTKLDMFDNHKIINVRCDNFSTYRIIYTTNKGMYVCGDYNSIPTLIDIGSEITLSQKRFLKTKSAKI